MSLLANGSYQAFANFRTDVTLASSSVEIKDVAEWFTVHDNAGLVIS